MTQFILGHFYLYKYQWNNEGTVSCVAVYSESLCQFLRERKLTNFKLYIFFTLKSWQRNNLYRSPPLKKRNFSLISFFTFVTCCTTVAVPP